MTTWLVTRHAGAKEWAEQAGVCPDEGNIVSSLEPEQVVAGDLVVGTLPINLAASVVSRGARYLHLSLEVPAEARGRELSANEMRGYGARLEEYEIRKVMDFPHRDGTDEDVAQPLVMIIIGSEQVLPNLLPILNWPKANGELLGLHILCSDSERISASVANLKSICELLSLPVTQHRHMPEGPISSITDFAQKILIDIQQQNPTARLVLNATGGTKQMAFAVLHALGPQGHAIYCDTERERIEFIQPAHLPPIQLPASGLDVEMTLIAHGIAAIKSASTTPGWLDKARGREAATRHLRGLATKEYWSVASFFTQLQAITAKALPAKHQFVKKIPAASIKSSCNDFDKLCSPLESAGLIHIRSEGYELPDEEAARYLQGGWLEEMLALCVDDICRKHDIPPDHWRAGMEITPIKANTEKPLNEIDIAIAYRNRLLVIECKSGIGVGKDDMAAVTKLESVAHHIGGRLADKWLLCSRTIDRDAMIRLRCQEYGIPLLEQKMLKPTRLEKEIERWLGFK